MLNYELKTELSPQSHIVNEKNFFRQRDKARAFTIRRGGHTECAEKNFFRQRARALTAKIAKRFFSVRENPPRQTRRTRIFREREGDTLFIINTKKLMFTAKKLMFTAKKLIMVEIRDELF
jgi:ribosomal protein L15E